VVLLGALALSSLHATAPMARASVIGAMANRFIVAFWSTGPLELSFAPDKCGPLMPAPHDGYCARMRIANIDGRLVTFVNGEALDVASASKGRFGPDAQAVYDEWSAFVEWGRSIGASGGGLLDESRLDAPAPRPRQVFGIGLNYVAHALEGPWGVPEVPAVFTKYPTCIVGARHEVAIPAPTTDWEVELVVVMGRRAHHVAASDAWAHVAGLTIGQDISERTLQRSGNVPQFGLGKSYPGFGPMGPWLVTPDEFANPDDLAISCTLNGELVQDSRTGDLVFGVARLVEYLSAVLPLLPGDVIFTGTPSGVGAGRKPPRFLQPGEVLVSTIEGIGSLATRLTG
jgi:2-keto-4-pentenoate hydratase/2-oxohepta-3-ene-1,7-dioic acid hydratase in catechol pathway